MQLAQINHAPGGAETAPPLLIAHGLFGQGRNFNTIGRRLATNRRVCLVDMRNHGDSPWGPARYAEMATDLAETIECLGGRADVLGHSMGGKAAMALALSHPGRVERLIVADIAPVSYRHSHLGFVQAMRAVDLTRISRRADADPMLTSAIPERALRAFLLQSLVIENGTARWRLNLEGLEADMSSLVGWPSLPDTAPFAGPTQFLHGGASDYVTSDMIPEIHALFPQAEFTVLPGAGHWLHAEHPDAFLQAVEEWLSTQSHTSAI